jgi:hypothetical protein
MEKLTYIVPDDGRVLAKTSFVIRSTYLSLQELHECNESFDNRADEIFSSVNVSNDSVETRDV